MGEGAFTRVVDALCDLVPLRTRALYADAYTLVSMVGLEAEPSPQGPITVP